VVNGTGGTAPVDDVNTTWLNALSAPTGLPAIFALTQDPVIVPQVAYKPAYPSIGYTADTPGVNVSRISDTSLTFTPLGATTPLTVPMGSKAIQELFELDYGRMNATLAVELPFTNAGNQTTIPLDYIDPPTEILDSSATISPPVASDGTQIWKITHNGVDSHAIHFHLFNVQVINRVGWDGAIRLPDANEMGWKETVRMNPLEDIIVAMRPTTPKLPFGIPDSWRLMDVTSAPGTTGQFSAVGPDGNPVTTTNAVINFGWEYVWHCHLLGHEENDMMRPMVFNAPRALPLAPTAVTYARDAGGIVTMTWIDGSPFNYTTGLPLSTPGNPSNEIGFRIERAPVSGLGVVGTYVTLLNPDASVAGARANRTSWTALAAETAGSWSYRVVAFNAAGSSPSLGVLSAPGLPSSPTNLQARLIAGPQVTLSWTFAATNATSFIIERQVGTGAFVTLATVPFTRTSYVDGTVTAGNTYIYRVKAVNAVGSSGYATSIAVPVIVPAAPSRLTAGAVLVGKTTDAVTLRWTNNSVTQRSLTLQRCSGSSVSCGAPGAIWANVTTTLAGTATSSTVTGVAKATVFTYRIRAVGFAGPSAWSNLISVIFP
jgi:hypothetical protein